MWFELALISIILACWAFIDTRKPDDFPPGPPWLPVLGNLLYIKRLVQKTGYHHKAWARLAAQYGPVVGVKLGRMPPTILVSGRDAVQEVLSREEFDGRPDEFTDRLRTMGKRRGVMLTDGSEWKEQRHFVLRNLHEFGFGTRSMETLISAEARACVDKMRTLGGANPEQGVAMEHVFTVPVLNTLWSLIAGQRFDDDHPTLLHFLVANAGNVDSTGDLLNVLPELRHIAPHATGFSQLAAVAVKMWTLFSEIVWEHKQTIREEYSRDLIDVYLKEIQKSKKNHSFNFSELQLISLMKDLFVTGSETSSNTLSYAILYLLLNPAVQAEVQREIDHLVGRDRPPSLSDRNQLPYVNAVLMEVQRLCNIAPMVLPHRAMRDTQLGGFHIPAGATLLASLSSLHLDVDHWGDPLVFRPTRFLDSNTGQLVHDAWFLPFGAGKRRCLGESMARDSLFLFFSLAVQQLTFTLPANQEPPSPDGINGPTLSTGPFNAVITAR